MNKLLPTKNAIVREVILAVIAGGISYGTVLFLKSRAKKKKAVGI